MLGKKKGVVGGEKTGVEETEILSQRTGVIFFLYLSLFSPSIFPSLPQAKEISEKGNAVSSRVPGWISFKNVKPLVK